MNIRLMLRHPFRRLGWQVWTIALLSSVASGSTSLPAQDLAPMSGFGVVTGGGLTVPQGDAADYLATGWHVQAGVTFRARAVPFAVRLDAHVARLGGANGFPGNEHVIAITSSAVGSLPGASALAPYVMAGPGIYHVRLTFGGGETPRLTSTERKVGLHAGIGVLFRLGAVPLGIETRYHHILTEGTRTQLVPITAFVRF